jgi:hypothetical protein
MPALTQAVSLIERCYNEQRVILQVPLAKLVFFIIDANKPTAMHHVRLPALLCIALTFALTGMAQQPLPDSTEIKSKWLAQAAHRAETYNEKIDRQTEKYLRKLERQEKKLQRKLNRVDSTAAKALFSNAQSSYAQLSGKIKNSGAFVSPKVTDYLPLLDSSSTALKFITNNEALQQGAACLGKAKSALHQVEQLQQKLQSAADIKKIIAQRKEQLKAVAEKYNLTKYLKQYNKTAYYYAAQINEYKTALNNPEKAEKLLLAALNKIPAFKNFFAQFSTIGQLFPPPPGGTASMASLAGLQTRAQVNTLLTQQLTAAGPGATQQLQQTLQQAQQQLSQLKDKVMKLGGQSGDMYMPDFKANSMHTKSFWQRLSVTTDFQPVKGRSLGTATGSNFLPNGLDMGLGLAYKLNDKKILGAQLVYKAGLGNGLNAIKLSHQGVGYRLYADLKFKGSFWLSAGYENQYRSGFKKIAELQNRYAWQTSAVAGLSKKYRLRRKGGEMKLLYNFLWKQQVNGQWIIWRTGIVF